MKRVCSFVLAFFVSFTCGIYPAFCSDGGTDDESVEPVVDVVEVDENTFIEIDNTQVVGRLDTLYELFYEYLSLGSSGDLEDPVEDPLEENDLENPPAIHELMEVGKGGGFSLMSVRTQVSYPYTGGAFMAVNTNLGSNCLVVSPEDFKVNTFGFVKGTDRVVNLTNSTINCYFIRSGTTYSARFQRYGELEYYYQSGSNWYWGTVTINALTDSNIQFLDETGERGIQRPYLSLTDRLNYTFAVVGIGFLAISTFLRR